MCVGQKVFLKNKKTVSAILTVLLVKLEVPSADVNRCGHYKTIANSFRSLSSCCTFMTRSLFVYYHGFRFYKHIKLPQNGAYCVKL